jgi:dolichyl-phosphate beta-glucosyltransferase
MRGHDLGAPMLLLLLVLAGWWHPAAALVSFPSSQSRDRQRVPFLTVLLPAYNEEQRLPVTLRSYQACLAAHSLWATRSRIVVANDGSTDGTAALVATWNDDSDTDNNNNVVTPIPVSCVSLPANAGKGAALAAGLAASLRDQPQGWILTADADGSAPLSTALEAMMNSVFTWYRTGDENDDANDDNDDVPPAILVAGYRTYAQAAASRLLFRWGFRTLVRLVCGDLGVRDSQCGAKLLNPPAAAVLYRDLYLSGWSHDVEVLWRARQLQRQAQPHSRRRMVVLEAAVDWHDQPGSKLVASPGGVLAVSAQMFANVLQLRWGYTSGAWRMPPTDDATTTTMLS